LVKISFAVKGLKDHYGSPVPQDIIQFNIDSVNVNSEFFITSYQILSPYRVKITFKIDVDQKSVSDVNNYVFQPENTIEKIDLVPSDTKSAFLTLKGKPVGSVGEGVFLKDHERNVFHGIWEH
jgi:hypothetical protein